MCYSPKEFDDEKPEPIKKVSAFKKWIVAYEEKDMIAVIMHVLKCRKEHAELLFKGYLEKKNRKR